MGDLLNKQLYLKFKEIILASAINPPFSDVDLKEKHEIYI